jgi:threonine aldolase
VDRLLVDHQRAKVLGEALKHCSVVASVLPVYTNIVVFQILPSLEVPQVILQLKSKGVLCAAFGPQQIRLVTHLDFTDTMLDYTLSVLKAL